MYDHIWINGSIVPLAEARLSPASAGALYGWGVFTTLGVAGGRPVALDRHWERLEAHAARALVTLDWTREEVAQGLFDLLAQSGIGEGRARVTVLRARAGLWQAPTERSSDVMAFVAERPARETRPLALTVSRYRLNSGAPLAGVKATAYIEHLVALDEARARGFDEAIMLNERGEVVEATSANLFWRRRDELFTPSLATGCLAGIMRRLVLEAATRLRLHVVEGGFHLTDLHDAEELFATNSGWGLVAAGEVDIHRYDTEKDTWRRRLEATVVDILTRESRAPRAPANGSGTHSPKTAR